MYYVALLRSSKATKLKLDSYSIMESTEIISLLLFKIFINIPCIPFNKR